MIIVASKQFLDAVCVFSILSQMCGDSVVILYCTSLVQLTRWTYFDDHSVGVTGKRWTILTFNMIYQHESSVYNILIFLKIIFGQSMSFL